LAPLPLLATALVTGATPCGLVVGGCPLRAGYWHLLLTDALQSVALEGAALQVVVPASGCCPYGRSPLYRWAWPLPTAPARGLAVASHPYKWPSHGRLPPVLATGRDENRKR
ncbi:hypothetical protein BHM03_00024438, partial [Ensete ventricosum]